MNRLILIAAFVVTSASLAQTPAPTPSAAQETASAPGDGQPCAPEFGMTPTEIFTDCAPLKVRGPLFAEEIFTRDGSSYFKATDEVTVKVNTQTTPPVASKPLVSVTNSICFLTGDSRHGNRSTCWINENNGMRYL
ncbi:MAG TPA: hypothetical protein VE010_15955, partial [Thermoanaerobaculia bacterium]|nr:hypothetical protein [Thermoanaerobaculia bacterium]